MLLNCTVYLAVVVSLTQQVCHMAKRVTNQLISDNKLYEWKVSGHQAQNIYIPERGESELGNCFTELKQAGLVLPSTAFHSLSKA